MLIPRLKALDTDLDLAEQNYFRKPPEGDVRDPLPTIGVRALEFPRWFACQGCRRLARAADQFERGQNAGPAPELVWTGPEGQGATARDTAVVLRELFESARDHVLVGPSATRARRCPASSTRAGRSASRIRGSTTTGEPWSHRRRSRSLHAKCVVVDGERAFVSSANQ